MAPQLAILPELAMIGLDKPNLCQVAMLPCSGSYYGTAMFILCPAREKQNSKKHPPSVFRGWEGRTPSYVRVLLRRWFELRPRRMEDLRVGSVTYDPSALSTGPLGSRGTLVSDSEGPVKGSPEFDLIGLRTGACAQWAGPARDRIKERKITGAKQKFGH